MRLTTLLLIPNETLENARLTLLSELFSIVDIEADDRAIYDALRAVALSIKPSPSHYHQPSVVPAAELEPSLHQFDDQSTPLRLMDEDVPPVNMTPTIRLRHVYHNMRSPGTPIYVPFSPARLNIFVQHIMGQFHNRLPSRILDTGATVCGAGDHETLHNIIPCSNITVQGAFGKPFQPTTQGTILGSLALTCLRLPGKGDTLISISSLCSKGHVAVFTDTGCHCYTSHSVRSALDSMLTSGHEVIRGELRNGLYHMVTVPPRNRPHTVLSAETTFPQSSRVTPDTPAQHTVLYTNAKPASTYEHVHASLGHPGLAGMAWHRKHTPGANYTDADANAIRGLCQGCVYGGMRQASTDHTRTHRPKPTRPGQQFSLDAFTCVDKSRDNIICCDILTDHFSRERYPIFTRDRSAAELCLKTSILFNLHPEWMSGQIDRFIQYDSDVIVDPIDVRFIRVDAESNYKSREFLALAASLRYTLERTPPRDKHANGIAERSVGLVTLKTNVIMLTPTPKVPVSFWPEAMAYACDTLSFNLVKTLNTSPYTLLHNAPVPLAYLQPFWTPCFVYLGQKNWRARWDIPALVRPEWWVTVTRPHWNVSIRSSQ